MYAPPHLSLPQDEASKTNIPQSHQHQEANHASPLPHLVHLPAYPASHQACASPAQLTVCIVTQTSFRRLMNGTRGAGRTLLPRSWCRCGIGSGLGGVGAGCVLGATSLRFVSRWSKYDCLERQSCWLIVNSDENGTCRYLYELHQRNRRCGGD